MGIHWLGKDQIKEGEELKAEHDEIYNEIAGCYGLEKCLSEFDLTDIQPGTKLWNLGLRKVDLSMSEMTKQRDELEQMRIVLNQQMRERHEQMVIQEEAKLKEIRRQKEELRRQEEIEQQKLEAAKALLESSSSQSSSSSARGQPFFGETGGGGYSGYSSNFFSNQSTVYGPRPEVFDRSYKYSSSNSRTYSRSRGYNG